MSDPKTDEEAAQAAVTLSLATTGDYLVSTACPSCETRFSMLVRSEFQAKPIGTYSIAGTQDKVVGNMVPVLRCVVCEWSGLGEQKRDTDK